MKKALILCVTALLLFSLAAVPSFAGVMKLTSTNSASLPKGTLVYYENFDAAKGSTTAETVKALGWTLAEDLKKFTAKLSIVGGKLHIDNLDKTVGTSNDSYALVMTSDYLKNICNADYTYQYDVTYLDAELPTRYLSMLCNYDGKNNYNTADIRIRGDGYNQVRIIDSWIHYNDTTCLLRATGKNSMLYKLYGEEFDANKYAMKNRKLTVRVEMSMKNGPSVYVNGVLTSTMEANKDKWGTINAYAFCFKTSTKLLADFDNLMLWTGVGVEPIMPVETTAKAATANVSATAAASSSKTAAAPATFDIIALPIFAAAASSVSLITAAAKRKNHR